MYPGNQTSLCPVTLGPPEGPNHFPGAADYVTCVPPGTRWKITQSKLFTPIFDENAYHPYPNFKAVFQYNNGDLPLDHKQLRIEFNDAAAAAGHNPNIWKEKRRNENYGGDSLMLELRIRPQTTGISGQNGYTFSPGILITQYPYFRVWSLGDEASSLNPDDVANDPRARCATPNPGATATTFGDNSRYFMVFDYVKTTSRVNSPFLRPYPANLVDEPEYHTPYLEPPLSEVPSGTQVLLEFKGANNARGRKDETEYSSDPAIANDRLYLGFRITLIGNTSSLLSPTFDVIAIPYLRADL
jgi:hypothetical protein